MELDDLNALDAGPAVHALLPCCGSTRWAARMAAARPFANRDDVVESADDIWSALDEAPTACQAIENFLRQTARAYSQSDRPQGCLIALGALHKDSSSGAICDDLRRRRAENHTLLLRRLERGVAEGELPEGFDSDAAATFYATVQHGMSIQARDGASCDALMATVAGAMAAWQGLAGTA